MLAMSGSQTLTPGWSNSKKTGGQGINRGVGKVRLTLVAIINMAKYHTIASAIPQMP
jgi:hypothetical protein